MFCIAVSLCAYIRILCRGAGAPQAWRGAGKGLAGAGGREDVDEQSESPVVVEAGRVERVIQIWRGGRSNLLEISCQGGSARPDPALGQGTGCLGSAGALQLRAAAL